MSGQASESVRGVATDAHAGRPCPYCRFALKATVDIVQCGPCGSIHHADCWDDNGGCSIMACPGGPGATAQTAAVPPPPPVFAPPPPTGTFAAPPTGAFPPPPPPPGGNASKRGGLVLILAILLLAFAISGVAIALVVTKSDPQEVGAGAGGAEQIDPTPEPTVEVTPEATIDEPEPTIDPEPTPESALPPDSRGQMRRDIQDMLRTWHEDIVNGDTQSAWAMLTSRKQSQNERKYGFDEWARGQSTLAPYLDPSGTHVSIVDLSDKTGVATVKVTGMSWSKPGARCSEWSGITWVRYEDGAWKYDPGYSTTPQREKAWKNRFGELLGGSC